MIKAARPGHNMGGDMGTGTALTAAPALAEANRRRLAAVFHAELDFVWRCLRRWGLAREQADDAAQQVFLVLARRLADVEAGKERAFLYATALRVARTARRSQVRRREVGDEALERQPGGRDPEQAALHRGRVALLDRVLAELPDELRDVLVLFEIEEMTAAAIAELLELAPGTVASRIRRARAEVRAILETMGDEP